MLYHPVDLAPGIKEPLCGWDWVREHQHDLDGWTPTFELVTEGTKHTLHFNGDKAIKEVAKTLIRDRR